MKRFIFTAASLLLCIIIIAAPVSATALPSVGAQSAVLMEAQSGEILFNHNGDARLPMASTTKIMTCLVVLEKENDLSKKVKVSAKSARNRWL